MWTSEAAFWTGMMRKATFFLSTIVTGDEIAIHH
jgi:hypothetical protein